MQKLLLALSLLLLPLLSQAQVGGYVFSQTNGTYTPLTGDSVLGSTTNDDERFEDISIGFPFTYNGVVKSTVTISNNGFINLDGGTFTGIGLAFAQGAAISATDVGTNILAVLNLDLVGTDSGDLSITRTGTAPNREFIVQWKNQTLYQVAASINVQARFQENGSKLVVVFGANSSTGSARSAQVGLRGALTGDFNSRTSTTGDWSTSTRSAANTDRLLFDPNSIIPEGLTFTWFKDLTNPDLELKSILPFAGVCTITPNQPVKLRVKNVGGVAIDTIRAGYSANGSVFTSQVYPQTTPLAAGDSVDLTFLLPTPLHWV
jgi:hypothetical protein